MSEVAWEIETSERRRARVLAQKLLRRARVVGKRRCRHPRPSVCLSCLHDSIYACARHAALASVQRDLSVLRRDTVQAGLCGSKREAQNFRAVQRILCRHHVYVSVLSEHEGKLTQHRLGCRQSAQCFGVLFWDVESRHVFHTPLTLSHDLLVSDTPPPWTLSSVGGKRPKAKPKLKVFKKDNGRPPPEVEEVIQMRLHIEPNKSCCMARTFRLFQCASKPTCKLDEGAEVCRTHMRNWRRHGLVTSPVIT